MQKARPQKGPLSLEVVSSGSSCESSCSTTPHPRVLIRGESDYVSPGSSTRVRQFENNGWIVKERSSVRRLGKTGKDALTDAVHRIATILERIAKEEGIASRLGIDEGPSFSRHTTCHNQSGTNDEMATLSMGKITVGAISNSVVFINASGIEPNDKDQAAKAFRRALEEYEKG